MYKEIYTTNDVHKILKYSARTIAKLIDSGILKGFKIPGSNHRRVTHVELFKFAKANEMTYAESTMLWEKAQHDMQEQLRKQKTSEIH